MSPPAKNLNKNKSRKRRKYAYADELQWFCAVIVLLGQEDQLRFGKREGIDSDVLHCCRARAQQEAFSKSFLQSGFLPFVMIRVVNRRSAQREKTPFQNSPGRPSNRTHQKKKKKQKTEDVIS